MKHVFYPGKNEASVQLYLDRIIPQVAQVWDDRVRQDEMGRSEIVGRIFIEEKSLSIDATDAELIVRCGGSWEFRSKFGPVEMEWTAILESTRWKDGRLIAVYRIFDGWEVDRMEPSFCWCGRMTGVSTVPNNTRSCPECRKQMTAGVEVLKAHAAAVAMGKVLEVLP